MVADRGHDTRHRIGRAGVHLAELGTDDGRSGLVAEGIAQGRRVHAALVVGRDPLGTRPPQADIPQRAQQRNVDIGPDDDPDRRRPHEPGLLHVPADPAQDRVPGGREGGEVGHRRATREADARLGREPEQLYEPARSDLLDDGRRGGGDIRPDVLVPGRRQPIGCQPGRHGATDHEPEEPRSAHGHEPGFHVPRELIDDRLGVDAALWERSVECAPQVVDVDVRSGSDAPRPGRRPIRDRESGGASEQVGRPRVGVIGSRSRGLGIGRDITLLRRSLRRIRAKVKEFTQTGLSKPLEIDPFDGTISGLLSQPSCPSVKVMGR